MAYGVKLHVRGATDGLSVTIDDRPYRGTREGRRGP